MRVENARTCVLSLESLLFSPDSCYGFFLGGGKGVGGLFLESDAMQFDSVYVRFIQAGLDQRPPTRCEIAGAGVWEGG